jgi:hypothetical protein
VSRAGSFRGGDDVIDLGETVLGQGPSGGGQPARLRDAAGGVGAAWQETVVLGVAVEAPQSGDEVFGGAASAAGVTSSHHVGLGVLDQAADLRRGGLVEAALAPVLDDAVPVGAVHPPGADVHRGGDDRHVLREGGHRRGRRDEIVEQVVGGQSHPGKQQTRGSDLGGPSVAAHRGPPAGGVVDGSGSRPVKTSMASSSRSPPCRPNRWRTAAGSCR